MEKKNTISKSVTISNVPFQYYFHVTSHPSAWNYHITHIKLSQQLSIEHNELLVSFSVSIIASNECRVSVTSPNITNIPVCLKPVHHSTTHALWTVMPRIDFQYTAVEILSLNVISKQILQTLFKH